MSFLWSTEKSRKREKSPEKEENEASKVPKTTESPSSETEKKETPKKGTKRSSENPVESKSDVKRSKNSSSRNEITSSLSSSKNKRALEEVNEDIEVPKKVQKSSKKLIFSEKVSPHKLVQSLSESEDDKPKDEPKIIDPKALQEDQEKSEKRGEKLLEAFND